jgi:hypothetical protein
MELEIEVDTKDNLVQKVSPTNGTAKRCKVCGELKPISQFHPHHLAHDGHVGTCMRCQRLTWGKKKDVAIPVNPLPVHPTQAPEYVAVAQAPALPKAGKSFFTLLQMVIEELTKDERAKLVDMVQAYDKGD